MFQDGALNTLRRILPEPFPEEIEAGHQKGEQSDKE